MDIAAYAKMAAAARPMPVASAPAPIEGLVAHVDGDYCAYYCAGNDDTDSGTARRALLSRLDKIKFASGAMRVIVHITDRASTKGDRYLSASVQPYQGQRKGSRKPRNWELLREYMEGYDGERFTVKSWNTREADDGIAYVAHAAASDGRLAVICTADKDMRMLPGRHITWLNREIVDVPFGCYELIHDGLTYGHKWFWLQMLQGDGADYIPGLEGYCYKNRKGKDMVGNMGEATAASFLAGTSSNEDAYGVVTGLYSGYYGDEWQDRFVEQASLLWLRTDRHAELLNFMSLMPWARSLDAANQRMLERVQQQKNALRELTA